MNREPRDPPESALRRLVEPIIYGDVFDAALTLEELHRYCRVEMSQEELGEELARNEAFSRIVSCQGGLYFLRGREELVEVHRRRREASEKAWTRARRVAGLLRYVPFIRGILVTGSLAVDNARRKDDLDFLVLTESGRLWSVFFVLGVAQRIFSKRFLCPNYYISIDHLRLRRESFYIAREVTQARPIAGAEACRRFRDSNRWALERFPNNGSAGSPAGPVLERRGLLRFLARCIEWPLSGRLGDAVEGLLRKLLQHRLQAHYGKHDQSVPESVLSNALGEVELRFHGLDHENMITREVRQREERFAPLLPDRT